MKKAVGPTLGVLLVLCGVGAYGLRAMSQGKGKGVDASKARATVTRGTLTVTVVENGTVDAVKSVEVRSRVTGRLAKLLVDEGDHVAQGQLIAVIDPKETQLVVDQNVAQLQGAQSAAEKAQLEIDQRRLSAKADYEQALAQAHQLKLELAAQPELTKASIVEAQTALNSAVQDRDRLVSSVHPQQRIAAESAVQEAQANYETAKSDYDRQAGLEQKGYVSGKVVETAKLTLDLANVRLQTAKQNREKLEAQLRAEAAKAEEQILQTKAALRSAQVNAMQDETKRQQYLSAVANVQKAKSELDDPAIMEQGRQENLATVAQLRSVLGDAQWQLGETEIRAPISGIVTKKGIQVGELATGLSQFSNGTTIVTLEDRTSMRVLLDMNEIDVAKLAIGMPAQVNVDALPNEKFTGEVVKIAPAAKEAAAGATSTDAVVRYQVEIRLHETSPHLRSGMSGKCSLDVVHKPNVLLLPLEYVGKKDGKSFVMLAPSTPTGQPVRRDVVTGAASGAQIEIISGLQEGDQVVRPPFDGPSRQGMMQFRDDQD